MTRSISVQLPMFLNTGAPISSDGSYRTLPDVEAAPWYHAAPSAVLRDQVQYVRTGRRRLWTRWALLILTFGALIGLTIARYVGSDELQSVVTLIRDTKPLQMEEEKVANATCPCQETLLPWANFTSLSFELQQLTINTNTRDLSFTQCYGFISLNNTQLVSEMNVSRVWNERLQNVELTPEHQEIQDHVDKAAELILCAFALQTLLLDTLQTNLSSLPPSALFSSPYLATGKRINDSWEIYAKTLIKAQRLNNMIAYAAIRQTSRGDSGQLGSTMDANNYGYANDFNYDYGAGPEAGPPDANLEPYEAARKITQIVFNDQTTEYSEQLYGLIFTFMHTHVSINWTDYKTACNPSYCDIVARKSVRNRVTEFLGLFGGFWNIVTAAAAILAWLIRWTSCLGPGGSSYKAWHP